ncbi:acetamidase/formamidase family protein [Castellaniella caeni]|uniref:acetamidase/formamidase family protein n=1 Tax=Castellaniella caeni TaxID=266123 RepID=UPI0008304DB1|nr:acetamidase/formamidase family protein [Castellaniella caeni]
MTQHILKASEQTVHVGVIDRAFAPVLDIDAGDEVVLDTWGMWGHAIKPGDSFEHIMQVRQAHAGRGPHSLTGPIAVRGARAGGLLRVDILDLQLGDYGFNLITPPPKSRGLLAGEFPQGEVRHFVFDLDRMETEFLPGMRLPLRPFLGIMGVAPAAEGPHISSVPGEFGGNIDCPDLVAGTTLLLPIWVDQALFYTGDAHAMQGCGEVCQTALETSMKRVHLRFGVEPQRCLDRPHAMTPEHLITLGFHADLREAATQAVADMVSWLAHDYGLSRSDAYSLCSLQADLMITQAVNGNNGVHARLSRRLLAGLKSPGA